MASDDMKSDDMMASDDMKSDDMMASDDMKSDDMMASDDMKSDDMMADSHGDMMDDMKSMSASTVAHGEDGPPGVLLAPGKSISFEVTTDAETLRIIAMVAPTMVPDNYLTEAVSLTDMETSGDLLRYDIGYDEGTKTDTLVGTSAVTYTIAPSMM